MVFRPFESTINLVRKLLDVGVATAVYSSCPGGQQLLKSAGIDDLFGVCVDGVPAAVLVEATRQLGVRPQRSVVVDDAGAGIAAARERRFRTCHRCRPRRESRPTTGVRRRRRGRGPGRRRCTRRRQADLAAPRCGGVIRSDHRCSGCARANVVCRLRRNVVPHRCRSQRRHPRRRSGQGAGKHGVAMPRRHTERPRPRRYPHPGTDTGYLVRGQPRL